MSDARWALIEPVFAAWRAGRTGPGVAARVHDLRETVNAILYVNHTGIPWEYLPHDFPPHKTVDDYHAKWEADGTTRRVHDLLRDKTRRAHGRAAEPSAAMVDAQSVKTSANVAETSQGSAQEQCDVEGCVQVLAPQSCSSSGQFLCLVPEPRAQVEVVACRPAPVNGTVVGAEI
ncbi:transposase [Streptomyces sp. NPDC058695]|uniref:transposase n=1 Tax=Streptomyces sp. NPDC058695 TaxID=3346604 RepID=UPI0036648FA0